MGTFKNGIFMDMKRRTHRLRRQKGWYYISNRPVTKDEESIWSEESSHLSTHVRLRLPDLTLIWTCFVLVRDISIELRLQQDLGKRRPLQQTLSYVLVDRAFGITTRFSSVTPLDYVFFTGKID